jgi:hypothetical protein
LVARTASKAVTVDFVAPPLAAAIVTTFITESPVQPDSLYHESSFPT